MTARTSLHPFLRLTAVFLVTSGVVAVVFAGFSVFGLSRIGAMQ